MRTSTIVCLAVMSAGALGVGLAAGTRPAAEPVRSEAAEAASQKGGKKVSRFMRGKLEASQNALDGLVTEDFDKIEKGAEKMVLMSKAADWQVLQSPTYAQFSAEFRRNAERMSKSAKAKQLDSAALSYMQITMNCINCHKYVKSAKVAMGEPLPPSFDRQTAALERGLKRTEATAGR